jgi:uncharacterized phage-like protein YoqJ
MPAGMAEIAGSCLEEQIRFMIARGISRFIAGGALGFDTLAAGTVLRLKKEFPSIRLVLVLPCPEQAQRWKQSDIERYENIKGRADEVIYTSQSYYKGCMQKRNRYMVDQSCCCVCYLTKKSGGTKSTIDYCIGQNVHVINIANYILYKEQREGRL